MITDIIMHVITQRDKNLLEESSMGQFSMKSNPFCEGDILLRNLYMREEVQTSQGIFVISARLHLREVTCSVYRPSQETFSMILDKLNDRR